MKDTSLVDLFQLKTEQTNSIVSIPPQEIKSVNEVDSRLDEDFEKSRDSIRNVIDHSKQILEDIIELCKITDSPRAFESTSSLITAITSASKDLLELHEKFNKLKNQEKQTEQSIGVQNNTQQNIFFKGTSLELLELIKNNKNQPKE